MPSDIVLEEEINRPSEHRSRISVNGPNTNHPSNRLRTEFKIHQFVLAFDPEDRIYKSGYIFGIGESCGIKVYSVKLDKHHDGKIIETEDVQ